MTEAKIDSSWRSVLSQAFENESMIHLKEFLLHEQQHNQIFPKNRDIFNAFNLTPFENVKVVILGQDPYHGDDQAHGLAFSVQKGNALPPSLVNIFKELQSDLGIDMPEDGDLSHWAKEGVLLLNTVLTVRAHEAHSHRNQGWETFTDAVISAISKERSHVVFILWGKPAQSKKKLIDISKHLIIEAPHPSPLSAYRGFFGSKPFSQANDYLKDHGIKAIDWHV